MNKFQDTLPMAEAWPMAAQMVRQPRTGRLLVYTGKVIIGREHRAKTQDWAALYGYRAVFHISWGSILYYVGAVALSVLAGVLWGYR